jgi:transcriptional regulator with XRE-family HTH domain
LSTASSYERARFELADLLRKARRSRNKTGPQLSEEIQSSLGRSFSQSKISKIETRRLTPSLEDVKVLLSVLDPPKALAARIEDLAERLSSEISSWEQLQRHGTAPLQFEILLAEEEARTISVAQMTVIPGLLQTGAYAREILTRVSTNRTDLGEAVAARLERQQLLDREDKKFKFVIAEWVLLIPIVPVPLMELQLDRLLSISRRENVELSILPLGADADTILSSFELIDDGLVLAETLSHQELLRQPEQIAKYREAWEALSRASAKGDASRALIKRAKERLSEPQSVEPAGVTETD